ncbi:hypothetical protein LC087_18870 (plasmid) [Bacillus carboniphilus]|uniref:Uncharacterized protein n=1 Tax=Bacillus carboniphilus TaxID=86663 RepID=A0ABY9K0T1_9BACI|nr:hypothetical protein [Bacillus carboniphilus]WLR44447.1 hypothetical protein LC087_18870 [Bacillus carboniphilus]
MKKTVSFILIFTILLLGLLPQNQSVSASKNLSKEEIDIELQLYLEAEGIDYKHTTGEQIFSKTEDGIKYEVTYYIADGTFESKAYDVTTGKELDIEELERKQTIEGKMFDKNTGSIKAPIGPQAVPIILVPIATWVLEHLIAMAIAATLVSVIMVAKDEVKAELEKRLKKKNPTIIYRGGSSTGTNLTPREKDTGGLSYYRKMPTGKFTATTKEAVDKTKVLKAVIDGTNHVSVKPTNSADMKGWIASRSNANSKPHKFTKILQAISVASKN